MVKCLDDTRKALELIVKENAYPPRAHFRSGNTGELTRIPFHIAFGIAAALTQYTNGRCTYACEGWHQYRYVVPVTLYNLISPEDGTFLGEVDHLGEARVSMIWLMDGSIHLISDHWESKVVAIGR